MFRKAEKILFCLSKEKEKKNKKENFRQEPFFAFIVKREFPATIFFIVTFTVNFIHCSFFSYPHFFIGFMMSGEFV